MVKLKYVTAIGLFVLVTRPCAIAQSISGTIVVLNSSQDEIVVAADSRSVNRVTYLDNECKIAALGNKLVFSASNITGYGRLLSGQHAWEANAVARKEFLRLTREQTTQNLPLELAKAWGEDVKEQIRADLIRDREGVLSGIKDNVLTNGLFAGFDAGGILIVTGQVTYRITDDGKPITDFSIRNIFTKPPIKWIMGETQIADEYRFAQTPRAIRWQQEIAARFRPGEDPIAFNAIELVALTIKYHFGGATNGPLMSTVGGAIDAVRLTRTKGIQWIHRKDNCPED